jgi:hypothetical protein
LNYLPQDSERRAVATHMQNDGYRRFCAKAFSNLCDVQKTFVLLGTSDTGDMKRT